MTCPALGFALPDSAQQWAQRPPATPCRTVERATIPAHDEWWIMLDGKALLRCGSTCLRHVRRRGATVR